MAYDRRSVTPHPSRRFTLLHDCWSSNQRISSISAATVSGALCIFLSGSVYVSPRRPDKNWRPRVRTVSWKREPDMDQDLQWQLQFRRRFRQARFCAQRAGIDIQNMERIFFFFCWNQHSPSDKNWCGMVRFVSWKQKPDMELPLCPIGGQMSLLLQPVLLNSDAGATDSLCCDVLNAHFTEGTRWRSIR